jgi:hypothetical protein
VQRYYYNIHGIVKILSEVILYELEYFDSKPFPSRDADVVIKNVEYLTRMPHVRRKIIVNELEQRTKLTYTEHLGSSGAQFEILFINNKIELSINKLISYSRHVLYVSLIEPLLRFVFISKGYVLLHSACIGKRFDQGLLISAPPDTGKTTAVLKCMERGFSLLSDDMTILSMPNQALCFPKPMTISSHTYKTALATSKTGNSRQHVKGLGFRVRSMIHSKRGRKMMRKLSNINVPFFTINAVGQLIFKPPKYRIDDLIANARIMNKSKICDVVLLETSDEASRTTNFVTSEAAVEKAIENSDDAFLFPPFKEIMQYLRLGSKSADELLEAEKTMLKEFFSSVNCTMMKRDNESLYRDMMAITLAKSNDRIIGGS